MEGTKKGKGKDEAEGKKGGKCTGLSQTLWREGINQLEIFGAQPIGQFPMPLCSHRPEDAQKLGPSGAVGEGQS
jgi:hypothetical protein